MRLREKISKRFEDTLDIRSFVSVQTNFAILLNLLLTNEQMLLFRLHRGHSISKKEQYFDASTDTQSSTASIQQRILILDTAKVLTKQEKNLEPLNGYAVRSRLDKKLIRGIFDEFYEVQGEGSLTVENYSYQNLDSTNQVSQLTENPAIRANSIVPVKIRHRFRSNMLSQKDGH